MTGRPTSRPRIFPLPPPGQRPPTRPMMCAIIALISNETLAIVPGVVAVTRPGAGRHR